MKRNQLRLTNLLAIAAISSGLTFSCGDEETLSQENVQTSESESVLEASTDEIDNLSEIALSSQEAASGGRIRALSDDRLQCDGTTIVFSDVSADKTSGTVTVTFGPNGCTDNKGNIRKGGFTVRWSGGRWFRAGSVRTITLNNYTVNDLKIGGTRTLTCTEVSGTLADFEITWNVAAEHSLTWPDSRTGTRNVNKTKEWQHSPAEDRYVVSNGPASSGASAAEGTNRYGKSYTVTLTTPLVYTASCVRENRVFLPVSGVKVVTNVTSGKVLTMDFGDGTCDNSFTVTVDGVTKTLQGKNGSGD